MILWVKSLHIIFMVTWFSGLFYLPRLFVYHAECHDHAGNTRFKIMERKLYYGITTPGAVLTIFFGGWLLNFNFHGYIHSTWMHLKLGLVLGLIFYHLYLGKLVHDFQINRNRHGHIFYRWLNEAPVLFLVAIVLLVVLKP
jgi:putative membrane protein